MKKLALLALFGITVVACQNPENAGAPAEDVPAESQNQEATEASGNSEMNKDSLAEAAMNYRAEIEGKVAELRRDSLTTDSLRPQIRQKWAMIHFYYHNNELVRVKTYPHQNVSKRTEEFYYRAGNLVAAVIEDNGLSEEGYGREDDDKAYYYHEGEMVAEVNKSGESEYSIRKSDAERLRQEAEEYRDLATKR